MDRSSKRAALLAVALVAFGLALPAAGTWYAGIDLGWGGSTFQPDYAVVGPGQTPEQYTDRAGGVEAGLLIGREWQIKPGLALGLQARASFDGARWEAEFSGEENSRFRYQTGASLALSLLPALRLAPGLWLRGEIGWGWGRVHEEKVSSDFTSYDYQEWVSNWLAGVGLRFELSRSLDLTLSYRYRKMASFTYDTHLPDGRHWETVTDKPYLHAITGGICFRF